MSQGMSPGSAQSRRQAANNVGNAGRAKPARSGEGRSVCNTARRRNAAELNRAICAAAEAGTSQLMQVVQAHLDEMNLVNISTALHRLARLETDADDVSGRTPYCDARSQALLLAAKTKLLRCRGDVQPRCLSSIAWASARLRAGDLAMMQAIGDFALTQIAEFKPFELVILLWGFAKLQLDHEELFSKACDHILACLSDYSAACLATAVWSFAKAYSSPSAKTHRDSDASFAKTQTAMCVGFCRRAADAFADRLESHDYSPDIKPVTLENVMWGLATLQAHANKRTLNVIIDTALKMVEDFQVHEFTILVWSFARLGFCIDRLFVPAAAFVHKSVALRNKLHPQGLANLLWAFAKYAEKGNYAAFESVAIVLLPNCLTLLPKFKAQEFDSVFSALTKLGKHVGESADLDKLFACAARSFCDGALEGFFEDLCLKHIVSVLSAYARYTKGRYELLEPCGALAWKLIGLCPRFGRDLDEVSALEVLEAAPLRGQAHSAFEDEAALANVARVVTRNVDDYSSRDVCRLARATARLQGEIRSFLMPIVARRLLNSGVDCLKPADFAVVADMCGIDAQQAHPAADLETQLRSVVYECGNETCASIGLEAAWHDRETLQELENYFDMDFMTNLIGAEVPVKEQLPSVDWPSSLIGAEVPVKEQDPAVDWPTPEMLLPSGMFGDDAVLAAKDEAWPARLVVWDDCGCALDSPWSSVAITFELRSWTVYEVCNVQVERYHESHLQETYDLAVEAGFGLSCIKTLNLTGLANGAHELRFTVTSSLARTQEETFVHRFWYTSGVVTGPGEPVKLAFEDFISLRSFTPERGSCKEASWSRTPPKLVLEDVLDGSLDQMTTAAWGFKQDSWHPRRSSKSSSDDTCERTATPSSTSEHGDFTDENL